MMQLKEKLDVTCIDPRKKHPAIFKHFDALRPGQLLVIIIDYEPKALYYHLLGERGPVFSWEYFHKGPEVWQVKIRKSTSRSKKTNVGNMLENNSHLNTPFVLHAKACISYRYLFEKCSVLLDDEMM